MTSNSMLLVKRRGFLQKGAVLSVAGLTVLLGAGCATPAKKGNAAASSQDVAILNAVIALEHEGIAAYTLGAGSGLLQPAVVQVGVAFRGHHQRHRDEMIRAVETLGGEAVAAKTDAEYAVDLNAAALRNQEDVLRLALRLEKGATNAYLGLIPSLRRTEHHLLAARMAGDEAFHVAILANALGESIPAEGLMFGA